MTAPPSHRVSDDIAVIVVNYGTAALAIEAVESVLAHRPRAAACRVFLVDNASPGEDAHLLIRAHAERGWGAAVALILEKQNHGFGRGNNVVLQRLAVQDPPDKVLLLNPDARLKNDALDHLAAVLDTHPQAAAAGAALLRPDQTATTAAFRFPGLASEIARTINLSVLNWLLRSHLVPLAPDHPEGTVDWVSGASVMFRFSALRQVGFFDPAFFLYYEEVDLMRRLRAEGWQILYAPQARVIHEEGAATGQFAASAARARAPAYLYQSWAHYFRQAHGHFKALAIACLMLPAALLNMAHRRLRGRAPTVPSGFLADQWRYVIRPLLASASERRQ